MAKTKADKGTKAEKAPRTFSEKVNDLITDPELKAAVMPAFERIDEDLAAIRKMQRPGAAASSSNSSPPDAAPAMCPSCGRPTVTLTDFRSDFRTSGGVIPGAWGCENEKCQDYGGHVPQTTSAIDLALQAVTAGRMTMTQAAMVGWGLEERHILASREYPQPDGAIEVAILTQGGQRLRWPQDAGRVLSDMEKGDGKPAPVSAGIFSR